MTSDVPPPSWERVSDVRVRLLCLWPGGGYTDTPCVDLSARQNPRRGKSVKEFYHNVLCLSQRNRHHNVELTSDSAATPRDLNSIDVQSGESSNSCRADAYCGLMLLSSISNPPGATRFSFHTRRKHAERALPSTLIKSYDLCERSTPTYEANASRDSSIPWPER